MTTKLNDANVHGQLDTDLLNREICIGVSAQGAQTKPGRWRNVSMKVGELIHMLSRHEVGEKDGRCLLQGEVIDGQRRANAIKSTDLIILDLDTGDDIDAVREKIQSLGLFAVIYTTYSHMKPVTAIRKDAVIKWLGEEREPTTQDVVRYLREVKRYRSYILDNATLVGTTHTAEGVMLSVAHAPMPKFRVVFVQHEKFVFSTRSLNPKKAIDEWKERYAGVSDLINAAYDRSCTDPSRLMYTPRKPENSVGHRIEIIAGAALNINNVKRTTQKTGWDRFIIEDTEYKTPDLMQFLAKNGDKFEAADFFADHLEDRGGRNGSGGHFCCPNDEAHTNAGDPEDKGFFAINASDATETKGFVAKCMHDSCSELDRGHFIDLVCVENKLTVADLQKYVPQEEEDTLPTDDKYPADVQAKLRKFNEKYAYVLIGSDGRIMEEPQKTDEHPRFLRLDSFRAFHEDEVVAMETARGETKNIALTKLWMQWPYRRKYRGIAFEPNGTPPDVYNLWKGFPIKGKKGDWGLLKTHILENLCADNPDYYAWFMTWCAQMYQYPGTKPGSAVAIRGKKGTGKSKTFDWLRRGMGRHAIKVSQSSHVVGNFNKHQHGIILMVCEEAFWAGNQQAGGVLKDLITSNSMMMEAKGIDAIQMSNYVRLAMISNEEWVVPAGLADEERRFFVLEASDAHMQDISYFAAIDQQMENGGLEAMIDELMTWDPKDHFKEGWDILRRPPVTEGLLEQANESLDTWDRFFVRMIGDGGIEAKANEDIEEIVLEEDVPNEISVKALRDHYEAYLFKHGGQGRWKTGNDRFLRRMAEKFLLIEEGSFHRRVGTSRVRVWRTPPLKVLREAAKKKGIRFEIVVDD